MSKKHVLNTKTGVKFLYTDLVDFKKFPHLELVEEEAAKPVKKAAPKRKQAKKEEPAPTVDTGALADLI